MSPTHYAVPVLLSLAALAVPLVASGHPPDGALGSQEAQAESSPPGPAPGRLETAEVSGRVLAPDGTPAADVAVSVRSQWPVASLRADPVTYSPGIHWQDRSDVRTGAQGEFVIRRVSLGPALVVAEHESLGDAAVELEVGTGANRIELRLDPSGRIGGRVVDAGGKPVASALVRVSRGPAPEEASDDGPPQWPPQHGEFGVYSTGEDGRFLFRRLSPGEYLLEATAQRLLQRGPPRTVTAGKTPVTGVELVMVTGEEIHGRFLGLTADQALPPTVLAQRPGREDAVGSQVDEQGRYRLGGLDSGTWEVAVHNAPHGRQLSAVVEVVEGGGPYRLDFDLESGLTLSGRVRVEGEALAHGSVGLVQLDGEHRTSVSTATDGTFRIAGLEPGSYELSISDYRSSLLERRRLELTSAQTLDLDLATASLEGRLLDADGHPVSGGIGGEVYLDRLTPTPVRLAGRARIDSAGRFELPHLAPGTYEVRTFVGGRAAQTTVTLETGRHRELDLRMEPGAALVLLPTLAAGGRPERVEILIMEELLRPIFTGTATVSAQGEAVFESVPAGEWPVSVSAEGTAMIGVDITVPGSPVAVTLPPPTVLQIEVPDLKDVTYLPLVLTGPDGRVPAAGRVGMGTMLIQGRSRIDNLPPGTWTVTIEDPDGREYQGTATTTPARPTGLILESSTAAAVGPK